MCPVYRLYLLLFVLLGLALTYFHLRPYWEDVFGSGLLDEQVTGKEHGSDDDDDNDNGDSDAVDDDPASQRRKRHNRLRKLKNKQRKRAALTTPTHALAMAPAPAPAPATGSAGDKAPQCPFSPFSTDSTARKANPHLPTPTPLLRRIALCWAAFKRTLIYKICYYVLVVLIVLLHVEILTGGFFCSALRQQRILLAKPELASSLPAANATLLSAATTATASPVTAALSALYSKLLRQP